MSGTPRLALPLIEAAQAQKHVTHNEALVGFDTLVNLRVLDRDLTAPANNCYVSTKPNAWRRSCKIRSNSSWVGNSSRS